MPDWIPSSPRTQFWDISPSPNGVNSPSPISGHPKASPPVHGFRYCQEPIEVQHRVPQSTR